MYTTKISKSVSMYVGMYGYAFHGVLRYGAKTWHGVGEGPTRFESIFSTPPKVKGNPKVKLP